MGSWDKNEEEENETEELPWADGRLKGANSSIFTIVVVPKWRTIQEKVLQKMDGWKKLPDKLCREWKYRITSDYVSGLVTKQAEYHYGESFPVEIYSDVEHARFTIETCDSELDLENYEFKSL